MVTKSRELAAVMAIATWGPLRWLRRSLPPEAPPRGGSPAVMALVAVAALASPLAAQTIKGTLLEDGTDIPVSLGIVVLLDEELDSINATMTSDDGEFRLSSEEPGNFFLMASGLGYRHTTVGLFELGEGGEITIEFRLAREPLTLEGLLVEGARHAEESSLARNGFYARLRTGFGEFVTPVDLEKTSARLTEDLFLQFQGMIVDPSGSVRMRDDRGRACRPAIYLDGVFIRERPLEQIASVEELEAVEIYRRRSETPLEYVGAARRVNCGVIVFWTKR
jgi:hypothetical protein